MINTLTEIWQKILLSNLFNFVLMLVFLGWIFKKFNLSDKIEEGRKHIENSIILAQKTKEKSVQNLFDVQQDGIKQEKESLDFIESAAKNAVLVGEKLVDDAFVEADELSLSVRKSIETNIMNLKNDITNETANEALNLAKNHIVGKLKEDRNLHIKLVNESIEELKSINFD